MSLEKLKQIIKEKEYSLETILLCTPFESDSDRNLLGHFHADLFFNSNFYAEPCLHKQIKLIDKEISECSYNSRDVEILNNKKEELKSQIAAMSEFESIIKNCKFSDDISYIRSFPGSGKTTYLHKLIYDNKKTHTSIVVDFKSFNPELLISNSDYKERVFKTDDVNTEDTLVKFIFLLTDVFNSLIKKNRFGDRNDEYYAHLSNICSNFDMLFDEREEISDLINNTQPLIEIIKTFLLGRNYHCFILSVVDYLSQNFKIDNKENAIFLLRLITVLEICAINTEKITNRNYKFIIAFDNLEYFIDQDAIYDEDILEIEKILQCFLINIEKYLRNGVSTNKFNDNLFIGHFKILMIIRDSTNFLKGPRHNDDKRVSVLDITDTYNLNEIHFKRYNAFKDLGVLSDKDNEIYDTIQKIVSDISPYRNSSGVSIEEMFNHNKRRMTLYLYQILKDDEKRKKYISLINKINDSEADKDKKDILKNASRTYIIRLLLDNIQSTQYFSELLALGQNADDLGKGYTRRILTYLHLMSIENKNEYVGFYDLLHHVFDKPATYGRNVNCINDELFESIARILTKLNEPEKDRTKWCQLILIRFEHKQMSKDKLINELKKAYLSKCNNKRSFGIKITEAGSYYLTLLPKFEYFSCRYYSNSRPLYLVDNIKPNTNKNITEQSFPCYRYIEKVKKQTIGYVNNTTNTFINGCIQEIFNCDVAFFSTNRGRNFNFMYNGNYLYKSKGNAHGISQIKNIIIKHIGHLDGFRGFILLFNENEAADGECVIREHKKILSKYVLSVINEYVKKLEEYSAEKDESGIYYIDHYNLKNNERDVIILLNKIKANLQKEQSKLYTGDLSFDSLFEENDE